MTMNGLHQKDWGLMQAKRRIKLLKMNDGLVRKIDNH